MPLAPVPAHSSRLLDLDGLCAYLGVSERYARRLVAEDRIPVTRIGRKLWFDHVEIDRWIVRSTTKPQRGAA
jgi:excisionase family DNA binding protein